MSRQPLFGAAKMDSVDLNGVRASGVAVLDLHEVAGSKLVALIDQEAARDLFDARRILDIGGLDSANIKAAVLAYGAAGRRDWRRASVDDIVATSANCARSSPSACRKTDPPLLAARRPGSRKPSRNAGSGSRRCSSSRQERRHFSTASWGPRRHRLKRARSPAGDSGADRGHAHSGLEVPERARHRCKTS